MSKLKINPKNTFEINSLSEYISLIEKEPAGYKFFFRGLSSQDFDLLSTLGREYRNVEDAFFGKKTLDEFESEGFSPSLMKDFGVRSHLFVVEKDIFDKFKFYGYPELENQYNISEYTDWDILSIARHHGLITRFMDWSMNPLVGLYFSVYEDFKHNGFVYYFPEIPEIPILNSETAKEINPFEISNDFLFQPIQYSKRIRVQNGILLIQADPIKEFFTDSLRQIKIPKASKYKILGSLNTIGVNHRNLFPDLDGISKHINKAVFLDTIRFFSS